MPPSSSDRECGLRQFALPGSAETAGNGVDRQQQLRQERIRPIVMTAVAQAAPCPKEFDLLPVQDPHRRHAQLKARVNVRTPVGERAAVTASTRP